MISTILAVIVDRWATHSQLSCCNNFCPAQAGSHQRRSDALRFSTINSPVASLSVSLYGTCWYQKRKIQVTMNPVLASRFPLNASMGTQRLSSPELLRYAVFNPVQPIIRLSSRRNPSNSRSRSFLGLLSPWLKWSKFTISPCSHARGL